MDISWNCTLMLKKQCGMFLRDTSDSIFHRQQKKIGNSFNGNRKKEALDNLVKQSIFSLYCAVFFFRCYIIYSG